LKIGPLVNNSAVDCPILWLKPRTTGEKGGLKWQCVANCHPFYF